MKTILLGSKESIYTSFRYEKLEELSKEFIKRDIIIGRNLKLGNNVMIGENSIIGDNCTIEYSSSIGRYVRIGRGCTIGLNCIISTNTTISRNTTIEFGATIGSKTKIGRNCTIGVNTTIGCGATIFPDTTINKTMVLQGNNDTLVWNGNDTISIGCECKTIKRWLSTYQELGESDDYTAKDIAMYYTYIKICERLQSTI